MACTTTIDCPAGWVCDDRTETVELTTGPARENGSSICVNPTCGGSGE
jgi:hypothetical protein